MSDKVTQEMIKGLLLSESESHHQLAITLLERYGICMDNADGFIEKLLENSSKAPLLFRVLSLSPGLMEVSDVLKLFDHEVAEVRHAAAEYLCRCYFRDHLTDKIVRRWLSNNDSVVVSKAFCACSFDNERLVKDMDIGEALSVWNNNIVEGVLEFLYSYPHRLREEWARVIFDNGSDDERVQLLRILKGEGLGKDLWDADFCKDVLFEAAYDTCPEVREAAVTTIYHRGGMGATADDITIWVLDEDQGVSKAGAALLTSSINSYKQDYPTIRSYEPEGNMFVMAQDRGVMVEVEIPPNAHIRGSADNDNIRVSTCKVIAIHGSHNDTGYVVCKPGRYFEAVRVGDTLSSDTFDYSSSPWGAGIYVYRTM